MYPQTRCVCEHLYITRDGEKFIEFHTKSFEQNNGPLLKLYLVECNSKVFHFYGSSSLLSRERERKKTA